MKSKRMTRSQPFIHENFLLGTGAARELYHEYAAAEPILDYHCHLSVKDIADDRQFENLFEIWLEGDRYKWRAMRSNGIPEKILHRTRNAVREIPGLGVHRAAYAAQSFVSLDASGVEAMLRNRGVAG